MRRGIFVATLSLSILSFTFFLPFAHAAYAQSCQVLSWSPNYPNQVNSGQTIQVTSTINVSCAQWRTYYSARVDLIDRSSGRFFSTGSFQIGWQPDIVAIVSNAATAPQTAGEWKPQLNLYIFEEGGMVGSPFKEAFNINIVETNSSSQQQVAAMSLVAIPGPTASNVTSTMAQPKVAVVSADPESTEASYIAVVLATVSLLGLIVLAVTRKPHE